MADWQGAPPYGGSRVSLRNPTQRHVRRPTHPEDSAPGICRICRGEGTHEEPLFHPCKCSGSIQHVHQDCLMEWLSHSQKKYCELCKTSFRFTKFYNPSMPASLPVSVFFQQLIRYVIQNFLGWFRVIIAISFWVSWLPWFMRRGWASLFWISQESWGSTQGQFSGSSGAIIELSSTLLGVDVCPASPLFAPTTTSAESVKTMLSWWESQPITIYLMRFLLGIFGLPVPPPPVPRAVAAQYTNQEHQVSQSLLGNVRFLRRLTRSNAVNQTVISVFEGQIITIIVMISFILVILVRDYVVQQQPELNMRAGFDEVEEVPIREPIRVEPVQQEESENESDESGNGRPADDTPHAETMYRESSDSAPQMGRSDEEYGDNASSLNPLASGHDHDLFADSDSSSYGRHNGHLQIDTPGSSTETYPTPVRAFASLQRPNGNGSSQDGDFNPMANDWFRVSPEENSSPAESTKGKEKLHEFGHSDIPPFLLSQSSEPDAGPSRPRALSDGPQMQSSINPLANNTWSLAHLPSNGEVNGTLDPGFRAPPVQSSSSHQSDDRAEWRNWQGVGFQESETDRRYTSIRDQLEADEEVYQPPLEGRIIRIPSPPPSEPASIAPSQPPSPSLPASPVPEESSFSLYQYISDALLGFMWGGLSENEDSDSNSDEEANPTDEANADANVAAAAAAAAAAGDDDEWVDEPVRRAQGNGANNADAANGNRPGEVVANPVNPEAAGAAGMEPEAIEDMEDFEGIMELLGMRGPITNLFQNVIFCAVLVQAALFLCVFTPFNVGRISIWVLAKPSRLIRVIFEFSKFMQDLLFFFAGFTSWVLFNTVDMFVAVIGGAVRTQVLSARKGSWNFFMSAAKRILDFFAFDSPSSGSGMQHWSAISHQALCSIKEQAATFFLSASDFFVSLHDPRNVIPAIASVAKVLRDNVPSILSVLFNPSYWVIELGPAKSPPLKLELANWSASDITWAILAGYITIFTLAGLYMNSEIRLARGTLFEDWETGLINSLQQASGILKVITVISIEMLVFPLYCGLLLDLAVLPLFANATLKSRLLFTYNNPWTSVFVHWFVGTGYMFHFALFVSMCRKIMRPGVLYFIRDPDDPEFHPVRDVLERSLMTQLRKILFSAFVYGTLVIVCLGGVVWGLGWVAPNVLPIHYSSNEPVLEFPVDLLFYNFFVPLAFSIVKPGDGLQAMYRWCFRKSARVLRLTYFLFGERRVDEEGVLQLAEDSPHHNMPFWRKAMLGLDADKNNVIPKPWNDVFDGIDHKKGKSTPQEIRYLRHKKARLVDSGQLIKDGRFVRAPASDRVKIPKGRKVFLNVNERGRRTDGKPDEGLYATDQFQMVYLPPHLRTRIMLFILCIWTFAAVTGLSLTIIPLVLGRMVFKMALPEHVRTNDIYAFCIGIHILGFITYSAFNLRGIYLKAKGLLHNGPGHKVGNSLASVYRPLRHAAKMVYAYAMMFIVFPLVLSTIIELYVAMPTHTYINPPTAAGLKGGSEAGSGNTQHNIRIVESWTLGLLYMRLAVQLIQKFMPNNRFTLAMRAVLRRGWLDPNVRILTRAFVIPGFFLFGLAIFAPPAVVLWTEWLEGLKPEDLRGEAVAQRVVKFRRSYPVVAFCGVLARYFIMARHGFNTLKVKIRDDAYLMGERLQNYDGSPLEAQPARVHSARAV
ncbi:unnamed protein product [Clonostachys rosea]|uniref:RING-type E3 ubiquitin transferase n=1 Tax=Bionectria ochroleuca TaxID=29856 RepID=A0ABY6V4B3_BIOOC|nr:unnamed protein product [Clonostachys rosea]